MVRFGNNNGNNNTLILIIILGIIIVFGIYCVYYKPKSEEEYTQAKNLNTDSIEIITPADSDILEEYSGKQTEQDESEFIEPADEMI